MEILCRWELLYRWRTGAGETRRLERGRIMDLGHGCKRSQWQSQALNPCSHPVASLLINFPLTSFQKTRYNFYPLLSGSWKKIKRWRFSVSFANFKECCIGFGGDALEQTQGCPWRGHPGAALGRSTPRSQRAAPVISSWARASCCTFSWASRSDKF